MTMRRLISLFINYFIVLIGFLSYGGGINTSDNDSIKMTTLQEFTIQGNSEYVSPRKTVYIPNEQQKKASANGMELISNIAIPQLIYSPVEKNITTLAGFEVSYFINGKKADLIEIAMLRTKNVASVEYLDHPSEPNYQNAAYAVNFIVLEPEYGGYTRFYDIFQPWQLGNLGIIYSKFKYRRMTFDASAEYLHQALKHTFNVSNFKYTLSNNGVKYIENIETTPTFNVSRANQVPIAFRARYDSDHISISNTLGFKFTGTSRRYDSYLMRCTSPFENIEFLSSTNSPEYNRGLTWKGDYMFIFSANNSLSIEPSFSYNHTNSFDTKLYQNDLWDDVINNSKSDSYRGALSINYMKKFNEKHNLTLSLSDVYQYSKANYMGYSDFIQHYHQNIGELTLLYVLTTPKVYFEIGPYLSYNTIKTDNTNLKKFLPGVFSNVSVTPNSSNSINLYCSYITETPLLSAFTDGIIRKSYFLYTSGNPDINTYRKATLSFNYTWLPCNMFNTTAVLVYNGYFNRPI